MVGMAGCSEALGGEIPRRDGGDGEGEGVNGAGASIVEFSRLWLWNGSEPVGSSRDGGPGPEALSRYCCLVITAESRGCGEV